MKSSTTVTALFLMGMASTATAFTPPLRPFGVMTSRTSLEMTIVSPFDDSNQDDGGGGTTTTYTATEPVELDDTPLELTWDNVEQVLDEMRPYLIQDGGNVAIQEIDGPVVRLELQVRWKSSSC